MRGKQYKIIGYQIGTQLKRKKTMELNRTERLIISQNLEILKLLNKEDSNYESKIETLQNGYENEYENIFQDIRKNTLSVEDCNYVAGIINIFNDIFISYDRNKDKFLNIDENYLYFPGFYFKHDNDFGVYLTEYAEYYIKYRNFKNFRYSKNELPINYLYRNMFDIVKRIEKDHIENGELYFFTENEIIELYKSIDINIINKL